jgi:hypothetical protein
MLFNAFPRLLSTHVIEEIEELERSEKHFAQEERHEASRGKGWRGRQMRAAVDSVQDLFRTDELEYMLLGISGHA